LEGGFHGAGEDDDDGRRRVGDDGDTLPHLRETISDFPLPIFLQFPWVGEFAEL
jgi:hypothetical protein